MMTVMPMEESDDTCAQIQFHSINIQYLPYILSSEEESDGTNDPFP